MDLNQISVFVRVVDAGSLSKAAALLRQPKSRVSRRIAALERQLGTPLLLRTSRHSRPTEAGQRLYEQCRQHVYGLDAAALGLTASATEVSGLLRLTTTVDIGTTLMAPLLARLAYLHPELRLALHLSDDLVDLVQGGFDAALRIGKLRDSTLRKKALGQISFILVASPAYLESKPRLLHPSDAAAHRLLVFGAPPTSAGSKDVSWTLLAAGKKPLSLSAEPHSYCNNPRVVLELALQGLGLALLPDFLCFDALRAGSLTRLLPDYATKPMPVQLVWPAQAATQAKVKAFLAAADSLAPYFNGAQRA